MRIWIFAKALAGFTVIAMVLLFFSTAKAASEILVDIIKFEGLALAAAIVTTAAYPYVRGVEIGEKVLIISTDPVTNRTNIHLATALENGKLNGRIKVALGNGSDAVCTIEAYSGIITPARGQISQESTIKVI